MYYLVYKTTNILSGKFYIGSHQTRKIDDGYYGSGRILKQAIKKYGKSNFKREVICKCDSLKTSRNVESHLVKYNILRFGRFCYNRSFSGTGAMIGEDNAFYGKSHSVKTKKILSDSAKRRVGGLNPFYGKKHTQEAKAKIAQNRPNTENCEAMLVSFLARSKGWYCTPTGCFYSSRFASKITGVARSTIIQRCTGSEDTVNPNYQTPKEYWGRTWRENGYYFVGKITARD